MNTQTVLQRHIHSSRRLLLLLAAALLVLVALLAPVAGRVALAQDAAPLDPAALEAARGQVSNDEVNVIARELWCPLCSGVRLDTCELKACEQMKDVIRIKLANGENLDSIREYFLAQYGPQVLGQPPAEGFNLLAWLLPVLVVVGGGLYLALRLRNREPVAPAVATSAGALPALDDEYTRKLDEELRNND